jgi:hypothetical protein
MKDWYGVVFSIILVGLLGSLYGFFSDKGMVSGFFGSLRAFGIAMLLLAAHIAVFSLIGYISSNDSKERKKRAAIGAIVGGFVFMFFSAN